MNFLPFVKPRWIINSCASSEKLSKWNIEFIFLEAHPTGIGRTTIFLNDILKNIGWNLK